MWKNLLLITTQFATNVQLKDLTHKFFFNLISQIMQKNVDFVLTLKYMCQFGMSSKKFNPKIN